MKTSLIRYSLATLMTLSALEAAQAPFSVEIVDKSECDPIAVNDAPSKGMAKNRRADVSLQTTRTKVIKETGTLRLENGGVIWTTSDPANIRRHLDIKTYEYAQIADGHLLHPLTFATYNNYRDFFNRYQMVLYTKDHVGRNLPLKLFEGKGLPQKIVWKGDTASGMKLQNGMRIYYVLRVYDKSGRYDQTAERSVRLGESPASTPLQNPADLIYGKSHLKTAHIPIRGARVRIYGEKIPADYKLNIEGENVRIDERGRFVVEEIKPVGKQKILMAMMDPKGRIYKKRLSVNVKDTYFFMVGIADATIGKYDISGHIAPLTSDTYHDEDIFTEGRLAFYLKGKIKGKYLITAQMDTQQEELENIAKTFDRKDPRTLFRHLDPDRYYYVYGDGASLRSDADSQGRLYVRVDWDKSSALWGDYNTGITGNEFAQVDRSLYGAKLKYSSTDTTNQNDTESDLILYASPAQSVLAHNRFLGTGGSLYYLKHTDIVEGSAKVWVEVRQKNGDRTIRSIPLVRGRDYEIDDLQGRIILSRPLMSVVKEKGPSLIKDKPLDGDRLYLMVDYEYVPDGFEPDRATYGARGKRWINDHVALGATYAHEDREGRDYELKGADLTLKANERSYLKLEYAKTEGRETFAPSLESLDGGLSFHSLDDGLTPQSGEAVGVESRVDLKDLHPDAPDGAVGAWWKRRQAGYSSRRYVSDSNEASEDMGIEASVKMDAHTGLQARATKNERGERSDTHLSAQVDMKKGRFLAAAQASYIKEERTTGDGEGTLAAVKLGYALNSWFDLYTIVQQTIDKKGTYTDNDLYTVGANAHLSKMTMHAEASTGERGDALQLGADYALSDARTIYGTYTISTDRTEGKRDVFTVGQRSQITKALEIYSEHQFVGGDESDGIGHTFGLSYAASRYLTYDLSLQGIRLTETDTIRRNSISGGIHYADKRLRASSKLEYREDKSDTKKQRQYLTANKIRYRLDPSWQLLAKLNYSLTRDRLSDTNIAKFIETGIGFAWRPVSEPRFNMIAKYTYLYDLVTTAQSDIRPDEKSHIVEAELSWLLGNRWSVGGKLGYKRYKLRQNRDAGVWYESALRLAAFRLNYHLLSSWDALMEMHWLDDDDDVTKSGLLAGLYKTVGEHMKVGIGYNFSSFSDDLTHTNDYDAQGWFVNLVGKY